MGACLPCLSDSFAAAGCQCVVDSMSAEEEDFPNGDLLEAAAKGDEGFDLSGARRGQFAAPPPVSGHPPPPPSPPWLCAALQIFDERAPLYSFTQEEAEEALRTFLLSRALFVKALFHLAAVTDDAPCHPDGQGSDRAHETRGALRAWAVTSTGGGGGNRRVIGPSSPLTLPRPRECADHGIGAAPAPR